MIFLGTQSRCKLLLLVLECANYDFNIMDLHEINPIE